jgi:hypothetical protein
MTLIVSLVAALSLSLLGSLLNDAAAAVKANEKLAALIKAAQTEGMLNLVWGENTFRGLHGVRELVSGMNKQFGTSIIANWTPGPSQPQMAAKIAQEFAARRALDVRCLYRRFGNLHRHFGNAADGPRPI